jgi:hypothetical protein
MLTGNLVSIIIGGVICVSVSLYTKGPMSAEEIAGEWEKTRNIDNPLSPWAQVYKVGHIYVPILQTLDISFLRTYNAGLSFAVFFLFFLLLYFLGHLSEYCIFDQFHHAFSCSAYCANACSLAWKACPVALPGSLA